MRALGLAAVVAALGACTQAVKDGVDRDIDETKVPDAVPRVEPPCARGNPQTYEQDGKTYRVIARPYGYVERGLASWYGRKYHGRDTSCGEPYDMYAMTAAHPTLPLPSYVRVTNLQNKRSVVVRVNDRGPFKDDRVIDLSYVAAKKLGLVGNGTAEVEVRLLDPRNPDGDAVVTPLAETQSLEVRRLPVTTLPPVAVAPPAPAPLAAPPAPSTTANPTAAPPPAAQPRAPAAPPAEAAASTPPSGRGYYLQIGAYGERGNAERVRARVASAQPHPVRIEADSGTGAVLHKVQVGPFATESDALQAMDALRQAGFDQPRLIKP